MHGHSIFMDTNGEEYDGEWRDGKRYEHGFFTDSDGSM